MTAGAEHQRDRAPVGEPWYRTAVHRLDLTTLLAGLLAAIPIVVATARAINRGWVPTSDDAYLAMGARAMFTDHPILTGTYTSAAQWSELDVHHLGPALYLATAVPVRLFGPEAGLPIGIAVVNVVAVAVTVWLAHRIGGRALALLTALGLVALQLTMGSELLFDPWNPHAATLPTVLMLVATAGMLCRDGPSVIAATLAGSYALQAHLGMVVVIPGLAAVGLAGWVAGAVIDARRGDGEALGRAARWLGAALLVGLVAWALPLIEELTGDPGNLTLLMRAREHEPPPSPGWHAGFQATSAVVGLPPFWLPPSWTEMPVGNFQTPPADWSLALALGWVVAGLAAGLAVSSKRRDRPAAAICIVAGAGLVLGMATASSSTSPFGLVSSYLRYLWPIGMVCWLAMAFCLVRYVADRWPAGEVAAGRAAGAVLVAVAVIAVATFPYVNNGNGAEPWGEEPSKRFAAAAIDAVEGHQRVRVSQVVGDAGFVLGPPLIMFLLDHGIEVCTDDSTIYQQIGTHHRCRPDRDAGLPHLWVTGGSEPSVEPPPEKLASHPGLEPDDEDRRAELADRLERQLRAEGLVLTPEAQARHDAGDVYPGEIEAVELAERDPAALASSPLLPVIAAGIDPGAFGRDRLDELVRLTDRREKHRAALWLSTP